MTKKEMIEYIINSPVWDGHDAYLEKLTKDEIKDLYNDCQMYEEDYSLGR